MKKNNLTLKETFIIALENYKKKNFSITENLCNKILSIDSDHFDSLVLLSNIFAMNRNFAGAKKLLSRANEIKPNNLSVLNNLGTACKELGDSKKALSLFEKVIRINPNHANAQFNLGVAFYNLRELKKAKNFFKKSAEIQPNYALAFVNLANVCVELKEHENAVSNYKKAIEINPKIISAHNNLGLVFRELNDYQNAINCFKEVIKIKTNYAGAHHNLAVAFKELGKFDKAIESHEMGIKYEPENLIHYFYLCELKNDILDINLKNKIKKVIKNNNTKKNNIAYGNYLLSKYEQKAKNYEKELNYLFKGHLNYFKSKKTKFETETNDWLNVLPKIRNLVNFNKPNKNIKKIHDKIKPIFIIGVPRCGSTLIEKIIASGGIHIPIGEETSIIHILIKQKILKEKLLRIDIENFRTKVIEKYEQKGLISKKYGYTFTDKSLENFLYVNLIKEIFPYAKVVNCKRNVLSSIMSIFQNNLTELAWAHNMNNIFKYFNNYFEIIENYNKIYPDFIYELEFEKFVADSEEESKKLMKFCDLPWDKKCLEFYKRKDIISKTVSNLQIREAIYKHPTDKYLPYRKLLEKYGKKYSWFN